MPTIVVFDEDDEEFHESHPEKDSETFCGESFSHDEAYRIASFAMYVEEVRDRIRLEEDKRVCDACKQASDEWAYSE